MINNKAVESDWFNFEKNKNCGGANLSIKLKTSIK